MSEGFVYINIRCFDVAAGETCVASCPDSIGSTTVFGGNIIGGATGGSCNSTDNLALNSSIDVAGYSCTVPSFASRVETTVVCAVED